MGSDAHVGKDPENRKGKSEVQRLEEATGVLSEEANEQALSDSNAKKSKEKNPPGHVEINFRDTFTRDGQNLGHKHDLL